LRVAEPSVGVAWAKRVPVMSPLVRGRKVTENWQEALGARAAQGGLARTNWRGRATSRVRDRELAGAAQGGGWGGAVAGLVGEDLEAGVLGGVGAG